MHEQHAVDAGIDQRQLLVEDQGGTTLSATFNPGNKGKNPNSFVYRFVPKNPTDLSTGKLQALQVTINGSPLTFVPVDATHPTGDVLSANQLKLHTLGTSSRGTWITEYSATMPAAGVPPSTAILASPVRAREPASRIDWSATAANGRADPP